MAQLPQGSKRVAYSIIYIILNYKSSWPTINQYLNCAVFWAAQIFCTTAHGSGCLVVVIKQLVTIERQSDKRCCMRCLYTETGTSMCITIQKHQLSPQSFVGSPKIAVWHKLQSPQIRNEFIQNRLHLFFLFIKQWSKLELVGLYRGAITTSQIGDYTKPL